MHYVLNARKTPQGIVKTVIWKNRDGVVADRVQVGQVKGEALAKAIEDSYVNMRRKKSARLARVEKSFLRLTDVTEIGPE